MSSDKELIEKGFEYLQNYKQAGDVVPSLAGMAHYLDTSKAQLQAWLADGDEELADLVARLDTMQEKRLLRDGLLGNFNQTVTKMMLAKFGYMDKAQVDNISSDGSMSTLVKVSFVDPEHGDED